MTEVETTVAPDESMVERAAEAMHKVYARTVRGDSPDLLVLARAALGAARVEPAQDAPLHNVWRRAGLDVRGLSSTIEAAERLIESEIRADEWARQESQPPHVLRLNDYQLANLKAFVETVWRKAGPFPVASPFQVANTGDWIGEIGWMLPDIEYGPNATADEMIQRALAWRPVESQPPVELLGAVSDA